jgi:large subunit ribosomal protein L17
MDFADLRQEPTKHMPKLFGYLRDRYLARPGGYTRVLRIESHKEDNAPSAILELVDGPKDMRFAMTAKTVLAQRDSGLKDFTVHNVKKVTKFRPNGESELENMVEQLASMEVTEERRMMGANKERVYKDRRQEAESRYK